MSSFILGKVVNYVNIVSSTFEESKGLNVLQATFKINSNFEIKAFTL